MRRLPMLSLAVPAVLSGLASNPPPAAAQGQEPAAIENIVVTARRRAEGLQNVPLAVTALDSDALEDAQARDLSGLQGAVPNLNLVQGRGSASSANIFIRGIGQPDALQTFDPAVGVYLDGVYLSRIQGVLMNLYDIERIEVLRGPQGTLYGKNTIGGAINLITKRLDEDIHIKGGAAYGRFANYALNAYLGGPLVQGKLWASAAAGYEARGGLVTDPSTGERYNDRDDLAGRMKLRAAPSETLDITLAADYTRQRNALNLGRMEADLVQTDLVLGPVVLAPAPRRRYDFTGATSFAPDKGQKLDQWGLALTADWQASDTLAFTSITAYRDLEPAFFIDIDATRFVIGDVFVAVDQKQFSEELQMAYAGERLHGVFGLYFLREALASTQMAYADDLIALAGAPVDFTRAIADDQTTRSYAAFGQVSYDLADRLTLTAGLRYTYEEKDYLRTTTTRSAALPALNGSFAFPDDAPGVNGSADWDALTPSFTLDFQVSDDALVYASLGRGFKSGGFNGRANSAADLFQTDPQTGEVKAVATFNPEKVWTYEAGVKSTWAEDRVQLNAAAFYNDYTDFQARVGGNDPGSFPVLNAAKLESYGFEVEAVAVPLPRFTLTTSLGYLQAKYRAFIDSRPNGCSPATCAPPFAPKWNARVAGNYQIPIETYGFLVLNGEIRHVSSQFLSVDNRPATLFEDGYTLLNAFIAVEDIDRVWRLAFGVRNITNAVYKTDGQEFSNVGNIQTAYYGDPRTWQISLILDF